MTHGNAGQGPCELPPALHRVSRWIPPCPPRCLVVKGRTRGGAHGTPTSLTHPEVLWVTVLLQMQNVLPCCSSFPGGSWWADFSVGGSSHKLTRKTWLGGSSCSEWSWKASFPMPGNHKAPGKLCIPLCVGKGLWWGEASGPTGSWFGVCSPS